MTAASVSFIQCEERLNFQQKTKTIWRVRILYFVLDLYEQTIITFKNTHLSNADTEFLVSIYEDWNSDNSSIQRNQILGNL